MITGFRVAVITALISVLPLSISAQETKYDDDLLSHLDEMLALSQESEIHIQEPVVEFQGASFNADFAFTANADGVPEYTFLEGRVFAETEDFYFRGNEAILFHNDNSADLRVDWFTIRDSVNAPIEDGSLPPISDAPNSPSPLVGNLQSKQPNQASKTMSSVYTCSGGEIYLDGVSTGRDTYSRCMGNNKVTMACVGDEMRVTIEYGALLCMMTNIGGT